MSDKAHRILSAINGALLAIAGSFLKTNTFPSLSWLWQAIVALTAGGAVLALKPVVAAKKTEEPNAGAGLTALLPLVFIALVASGCATAGGKALKACELSALPDSSQALAKTVTAIALDPGSTVADLEQLAMAVGGPQFGCVVTAVKAWLAGPTATTGSSAVANALLDSTVDVRRNHALQVLDQFLSAHPSACAGRSVAERSPDICDSTPNPPTDAHACRKLACDDDVDCTRLPLVEHLSRRAL